MPLSLDAPLSFNLPTLQIVDVAITGLDAIGTAAATIVYRRLDGAGNVIDSQAATFTHAELIAALGTSGTLKQRLYTALKTKLGVTGAVT